MKRILYFIVWALLMGNPLMAITVRADNQKTIVFLGDSLTAGYGLDPTQAYPQLIQNKITADKLPYRVVNAGVSGDTTAGALRRFAWLKREPIYILVIALGANDGLRGVKVENSKENLEKIIAEARSAFPQIKILLAGMRIPPNLGDAYASAFFAIFEKIASDTNVTLLPFLLEGVAGHPHLNLPDGIHPNEAGQKILADTVWKTLRPML